MTVISFLSRLSFMRNDFSVFTLRILYGAQGAHFQSVCNCVFVCTHHRWMATESRAKKTDCELFITSSLPPSDYTPLNICLHHFIDAHMYLRTPHLAYHLLSTHQISCLLVVCVIALLALMCVFVFVFVCNLYPDSLTLASPCYYRE